MTRTGRKPKRARNAKILALRGTKSTRLIADQLGVSIGIVSGVCFRADYPRPVRLMHSKTGNKIGTGHHGQGPAVRRLFFKRRRAKPSPQESAS